MSEIVTAKDLGPHFREVAQAYYAISQTLIYCNQRGCRYGIRPTAKPLQDGAEYREAEVEIFDLAISDLYPIAITSKTAELECLTEALELLTRHHMQSQETIPGTKFRRFPLHVTHKALLN